MYGKYSLIMSLPTRQERQANLLDGTPLSVITLLDMYRGMRRNAIDTVICIEVLVQGQLENGGRTLTGDDGRVGKEEYPDTVPPFAILCHDFVLVAHPVEIPFPDSGRVMDTKDVDVLDLETGSLDLVNDPTKRARGICTGEDVLVHEKTPNKVLILPSRTNASDLKDEDAVVIEQVVHLLHESGVAANANVFGHLQADDLGKVTRSTGDFTVVHAQDSSLVGGDTIVLDAFVAKLGLVLSEGDTSDIATVVFSGEGGEGTPTTANVEQAVIGLKVELGANEGKFVVLKLLQSLIVFQVGNDARSVDHTRTEEPLIKVIASVIVVTNLLFVLALGVNDDFRQQVGEDIFEELRSEDHLCPVVSLFHDFEDVTVEVNLFLKVRVVEDLHGNFFLAMIEGLEFWILDGDVLLYFLRGKDDLLILAFSVHGGEGPVCKGDGDAQEDDEKEVGGETAPIDKGGDTFQEVRYAENECGKVYV